MLVIMSTNTVVFLLEELRSELDNEANGLDHLRIRRLEAQCLELFREGLETTVTRLAMTCCV